MLSRDGCCWLLLCASKYLELKALSPHFLLILESIATSPKICTGTILNKLRRYRLNATNNNRMKYEHRKFYHFRVLVRYTNDFYLFSITSTLTISLPLFTLRRQFTSNK